jgi:hypothetical protein
MPKYGAPCLFSGRRGIGVLLIAPYVKDLSVLGALLLISAFLVVAAVVAQFTEHTRGRELDVISP